MLRKFFRGNNKYFSLAVILFLFVLVIGFYEPIKLRELDLNWREIQIVKDEEIAAKAAAVVGKTNAEFAEKFSTVLKLTKKALVNKQPLSRLYNSIEKNDYSLLIWQDSTLLFWKNEKNLQRDFQKEFSPREIFFEKNKLTADVSIYDTCVINGSVYLIKYSRTVEKFYKFANNYFKSVSLIKKVSDKINIDCKIDFSPFAVSAKDARTFSTPLYNNFNNKIGMLYFPKLQASFEKRQLQKSFSAVQNSLAILIFLLFAIGLFKEVANSGKKYFEVLTLLLILVVLRYALYFLEIPKVFLAGKIIDPQYFSSTFGFGIVSSPLELTITLFFLLSFTIYLLRLLNRNILQRGKSVKSLSVLLFLLLAMISPLIFRGFAASVKSFIFESNLEYFNNSSLFPSPLNALMLTNLFLLAVSFSNLFLLLFVYFYNLFKESKKKIIILNSLFVVVFSFFSLLIHPILSLPLKLIALILLMYFAFVIWKSTSTRLWNYFFLLLFSSAFVLLVLSNFNDEIRRESIKIAAQEINRPKKNLYKFWLSQLITDNETTALLKGVQLQEENPYSVALKLWSASPFQKDDVPVLFRIFLRGEKIGEFNYKYPYDFFTSPNFSNGPDFVVESVTLPRGKTLLRGVRNIAEKLLLAVDVPLTPNTQELSSIPKFVETERILNRIKIKSGDFFSFNLTPAGIQYSYGMPNLSREQIQKIRSIEFTERLEAWTEIEIDGSSFQLYLLRSRDTAKGIRVIGLRKNSLAFTWFHFIKLFFFHSLLIFGIFLLGIFYRLFREKRFKLTFRLRLTIAFLVAAVIPLILLASYLRYTTSAKNSEAINYKLSKRAMQVENYLRRNTGRPLNTVLKSASENLGVKFSIFQDSLLVYSSYPQYYKAGLLPDLNDYQAVFELLKKEKRKAILNKQVENYLYHSVFYKCNLRKGLIIEVNDAFNSIRLPMSQGEFDIFLFGIYALAFIFTLIISTLLANQISNPIHTLTRATSSVGRGDLNIFVKENYKGEMGELAKGFNFMVRELRKSQRELGRLEREAAWKEMARQVAHEIKNPLTPMKLSVQHLLAAYRDNSPKFDEIIERVTTTLIDQIETLKNIASEFGNVAKMPKPELRTVELLAVLKDVINLFREEAIQITVDSKEEKIFVLADEDNLRRIFINLVRNSIQANASHVVFEVVKASNKVMVRISDDGDGIPQEYQAEIFKLDFTTKPDGMGLGLSIGKKYLESIDAEITLENSSAQGTTFLISFPVKEN